MNGVCMLVFQLLFHARFCCAPLATLSCFIVVVIRTLGERRARKTFCASRPVLGHPHH